MDNEQFNLLYRDIVPHNPGVYKYFDEQGELLYIGKAKNLKKRVSSYFLKSDHSYRIVRMVRQIMRIEFTIVDTEQDALLLENNLIKKHQPRYNILLKDDKTFPYIVIKNEDFPRVFFTRKFIKDGSIYLGPYTSVNNARDILSLLTSIFPLRSCTLMLTPKNIEQKKFKVCLEYHLKNCLGPCQSLQSKQDYDESIDQIKNILKSNFGSVMFYLKKKMNEYAANMQFEKANDFKEKIDALDTYQSRSTIVNAKLTNLDVYGYSETDEFAFISFFRIVNGAIIQARSFEIKKVLDESRGEILLTTIIQTSELDEEEAIEILLPFEVDIPFPKIKVTIPLMGDKKKLIELAVKNTLYAKQEKLKQNLTAEEKNPSFRIMRTLKQDLKLQDLPRHIECFDNSNFQGTNAVSAIVVFRDAKPSKKDYRFFNVKTVVGPDDFATMEEAVYRRYKRMLDEGATLPNLIIIDGGKGQLSSAVNSLNKLDIYGKVPIIGIAKRLEEIYFPEDELPLYINKKSESLKLIQKLRDEAHRFGITAHRNKRSRNFTNSELETIKGIGEKTMETLLKKFKSIKKLKEAAEKDIEAVVGIAKTKLITDHFKKEAPAD